MTVNAVAEDARTADSPAAVSRTRMADAAGHCGHCGPASMADAVRQQEQVGRARHDHDADGEQRERKHCLLGRHWFDPFKFLQARWFNGLTHTLPTPIAKDKRSLLHDDEASL